MGSKLLKIGEFSRLGQVSVRMLRHYEKLGLLIPKSTNPHSGYRRYTVKQLPILNRILVLKESGFSLHEVKLLINQDLDSKKLEELHQKKQSELEGQIKETHFRLQMVKQRLSQIAEEGSLPQYDVGIKRQDSLEIASIRRLVPHISQMDTACREMHLELHSLIKKNGLSITGPELSIYHMQEYTEENLDVETAVAISAPNPGRQYEELEIRTLVAEKSVASLIYDGPQSEVNSGVLSLLSWISKQNLELAGQLREIQLGDFSFDSKGVPRKDPVIELQIPVKRAKK
jgi:DNA-binding transcriptional MerR regulator